LQETIPLRTPAAIAQADRIFQKIVNDGDQSEAEEDSDQEEEKCLRCNLRGHSETMCPEHGDELITKTNVIVDTSPDPYMETLQQYEKILCDLGMSEHGPPRVAYVKDTLLKVYIFTVFRCTISVIK
jgi:hypothetical protein